MKITIERNVRKLEYTISIPREDMYRAFTSETEYNNFITELSKQIYDYALKHNGF